MVGLTRRDAQEGAGESSLERFPYELFEYGSVTEAVCAHLTTLVAVAASHNANVRER